MKEIWKTIIDYPDYQISNSGKVKSLNYNQTKKEKILINCFNGNYYHVRLSNKMRTKIYLVHRLVGIYFISNPLNLPQINHKDGNKLNNNDWNLEWTTQKENNIHAIKTGLMGERKCEKSPNHKLTIIEVKLIRALYKYKSYWTMTYLAKVFNVKQSNIWNIVNNITWKIL